jgi:hypothetical protein
LSQLPFAVHLVAIGRYGEYRQEHNITGVTWLVQDITRAGGGGSRRSCTACARITLTYANISLFGSPCRNWSLRGI